MAKSKNLAFNIGAIILAIVIVGGIVYFKGSRKDEEPRCLVRRGRDSPNPNQGNASRGPGREPPSSDGANSLNPLSQTRDLNPKSVIAMLRRFAKQMIRRALREYVAMVERHRDQLEADLAKAILSDLNDGDYNLDQYVQLSLKLTEERENFMPQLLEEGSRSATAMRVSAELAGLEGLIHKADDLFPRDISSADLEEKLKPYFAKIDKDIEELKKMAQAEN